MQSYRTALSPWAVFRCEPPATNTCVARFRKRNDADEYLRIVRQSIPEAIDPLTISTGILGTVTDRALGRQLLTNNQ